MAEHSVTAQKPRQLASIRRALRNYVYDTTVTSLTTKWYHHVLERVPENSHILDIGIGTGTALLANAHILKAKNLSVIGIDIDNDYIHKCRENIANHGLQSRIRVHCADVYSFTADPSRLFNHICFSGSFMLIIDPSMALRRVVDMLIDREDGRIYFTQTFQLRKDAWLEWLKPNLVSLTAIDFGNVTYQDDFEDTLHNAGVVIVAVEAIYDSIRAEGTRETRLIEARSKLYVPNRKGTIN